MPDSFSTLLEHGGLTLYPLILCSMIAVAVFLERLWAYRGALGATRALTGRGIHRQ